MVKGDARSSTWLACVVLLAEGTSGCAPEAAPVTPLPERSARPVSPPAQAAAPSASAALAPPAPADDALARRLRTALGPAAEARTLAAWPDVSDARAVFRLGLRGHTAYEEVRLAYWDDRLSCYRALRRELTLRFDGRRLEASSLPTIAALADAARSMGGGPLLLHGHAAPTEATDEPARVALSQARADAVGAALRRAGYGGPLLVRPHGSALSATSDLRDAHDLARVEVSESETPTDLAVARSRPCRADAARELAEIVAALPIPPVAIGPHVPQASFRAGGGRERRLATSAGEGEASAATTWALVALARELCAP